MEKGTGKGRKNAKEGEKREKIVRKRTQEMKNNEKGSNGERKWRKEKERIT